MHLLKRALTVLSIAILIISCSDFDEQDFTVLLPIAGEDVVFFTDESGTIINLDGSASSDVNNLGFEYRWEIVESPEGFEPALEGAATATPTLQLDDGISGRIVISMIIFRDDQQARDFINIDVNPLIATVLLINAIEGDEAARLEVPAANIQGNAVAPLNPDETYYPINLDEAADAEGNVELNVNYNNATLSVTGALSALGSYTLYLTGSQEAPELSLVAKRYNENTIPLTLVGLDAANVAPGVNDMVLFIDARAVGFDIVPVDLLFGGLGVVEQFDTLNYQQNAEILFAKSSLLPLPIWATVNGERVSNSASIALNTTDEGQFGTFVLFKDGSSEHGNTLTFINNSALLRDD